MNRWLVLMMLIGWGLGGCNKDRPVLVLTYSPDHAIVTIDGFEPENHQSPHRFEFFKPGRYRLDVRAHGHVPVAMAVVLEPGTQELSVHLLKDEAADPVPPRPRPPVPPRPTDPTPMPPIATDPPPVDRTFTVSVHSEPAGARVTAGRPGAGAATKWGTTPVELTLPVGGAFEITISHPGYTPVRKVVVAPATGDRVILSEVLHRQARPDPDDPAPTPVEPLPPPMVGGHLSVVTSPPCTVTIDGVLVGSTPLSAHFLPAGAHTVLMENREAGLRSVKVVEIEPGSHVRLALDL